MLEWLMLHTAMVLALALLAVALSRGLRLGPAMRHALWLVVLVKLLTPPLVRWPWALPVGHSAEPTQEVEARPERAARVERESARPTRWLILDVPPEEPAHEAAAPAKGVQPNRPAPFPRAVWDWQVLVVSVWVVGGVLAARQHLLRLARVRRLLRQARVAPEWLEDEVADLAARLGVRPPMLRVLPGLGSPLVWGCGAARLLWPEGLEECLSDAGRRAVLVHELAHLRRRDHWVGWLLLAAGCVWWWHPLLRPVQRQLGREAERACDAWVVDTMPGARRAFAEALLAVCQRGAPAPAAPVLGVVGGRRDLERRLVMVMSERVPCRVSRRAGLVVGVLTLLALPAWSLAQKAAPTDTPAAKPTYQIRGPKDPFVREPAETKPASAADPEARKPTAEEKLRDLEKRVKALTRELERLRKLQAASRTGTAPLWPNYPSEPYRRPIRFGDGKPRPKTTSEAPEEVVLARTTYKLPAGKAASVAKFLKDHVKASVLETRVDGDKLTVTTTPEVQQAIGQVILLVQGKKAMPRYSFGPNNALQSWRSGRE